MFEKINVLRREHWPNHPPMIGSSAPLASSSGLQTPLHVIWPHSRLACRTSGLLSAAGQFVAKVLVEQQIPPGMLVVAGSAEANPAPPTWPRPLWRLCLLPVIGCELGPENMHLESRFENCSVLEMVNAIHVWCLLPVQRENVLRPRRPNPQHLDTVDEVLAMPRSGCRLQSIGLVLDSAKVSLWGSKA